MGQADGLAQELLDIALDHLTLARSSLYRSILESSGQPSADTLIHIAPELDKALNGLRAAGHEQTMFPKPC